MAVDPRTSPALDLNNQDPDWEKNDETNNTSTPDQHQDVEKQSDRTNSSTKAAEDDDEEPPSSAWKGLGWLDRLLALWILLAIIIGMVLGAFVPGIHNALEQSTFASVSAPIAIGLIVMMYPILCKVKYETLHLAFRTKELWIQVGFSVIINWIVAPFLMLALSWAFLPDRPELREGLILVGIARCIAMVSRIHLTSPNTQKDHALTKQQVLIWTGLAGGDNQYCAILVAINSLLQLVLFAPLAIFFISVISGASSINSPSYSLVATSVAAFLGVPLGAAVVTRFALRKLAGPEFYDKKFIPFIAPFSLLALLYTIIVLFASQGSRVVDQIVDVVRVAAPLIVYFVAIFGVTLLVSHKLGFGYKLSTTQSFTAASNNFELAIAVAVATYGAESNQALAATVGPLIEVPVLLGLVYVVKWFGKRRGWRA